MILLDTNLRRLRGEKVKHFNRKIKGALLILCVCLIAFIGFSKAGILFSDSGKDVITVSTTKKTFDPNNYVASVAMVSQKQETTMLTETTTTTTTATTTTTNMTTTITAVTTTVPNNDWTGDVLSKRKGTVNGPSGKETYYNLNMTKVVNAMRRIGYSEEEYPYWIREDGVKMLGGYVIVAADYSIRPRGTIIQSSLGYAIVCDTGGFAHKNSTQLDVAVNW